MIINSSKNLYGQEGAGVSARAPIDLSAALAGDLTGAVKTRVRRSPLVFELGLSGDLSGAIKTRIVRAPLALAINPSGDLTGARTRAAALRLSLATRGDIAGAVRLALTIPPPILNQVAENAFARQCYAARLLGDGVEIKISSAVIEKPKNEIGLRVTANISKKQLSAISLDKKYTFQVGIAASPVVPLEWHTILENASLDSRTFSRAFSNKAPNDNLAIGLIAPVTDRLNRGPKANVILYDPNKTEISGEAIEKIYDNNGEAIETQLVARSGLNLHAVLARLRLESGFSAIETNIPNYEITRAEFAVAQTFNQSVAPFVGMFQPLFFAAGNTLWILDKTAAIPDEFAPRAIVAANLENLSLSLPSGGVPDGFELTYIESDTAANYSVTRTVPNEEIPTGVYGEPDYTLTVIERRYRDWKNTERPLDVLKTELISEIRLTYNHAMILSGRETSTFSFDAQAKRKGSTRTVEAMVPDISNNGGAFLLKVCEEAQTISYKPDPRVPRKFLQNLCITKKRELIAVDAENTYFDAAGNQMPFKRAYSDVDSAGNLTLDMTSEFGPTYTEIETLHALGGGQYQTHIFKYNHLRGKTEHSVGEAKTGDASISAVGGRSRKKIVWRAGVTNANRSGIPPEPFSGGEVPLAFLEPLCQRILKRRAEGKHEGNITVIGFDPSVDRGVFFSLYDRDDAYFGRYIAAGLRVDLENLGEAGEQKVTTVIDVEEI